MKKNIQRYLFAGIMVTSMIGCISPKATTEDRQIAQAAPVDEEAIEFKNILNSPNPTELAVAKMDKLFTLLLKANQFTTDFSKSLDKKLADKRKGKETEEPLESPEYVTLLKAWNLKESYSHSIENLYKRALVQRTDVLANADDREKSRALVRGMTNYVKSAQNLKRLELQPLLTNLSQIYKDQAVAYKQSLRNQGGDTKSIAAISEVSEYNDLIFKDGNSINQYAKSAETKEKSGTLLNSKYKKFESDIDADLAAVAEPVFDRRNPQAYTQDLQCKDGKKLCVSTGESGNMVGAVFPKGIWAFTYDDGPTPAYSRDLMDQFIKYKDSQNSSGKASFFWTAMHFDPKVKSASDLAANQAMIKKAIDNNFTIANHSYDHSDLNRASTDRNKQIITSNNILETAIRKEDPSYKIQYFRCPYGSCYAPKIPAVREMIVKQGQMHVYWRIDSLDWKYQNSEQSSSLVIKQIQLQDHGIILMHDVQATTPETTRRVLTWLKDQNDNKGKSYKMVTIQEAVDLVNGK